MIESPQQALARIRDTVQAAENAGRLDLMRPFFGDDLVIMAPGFPPVVGAQAAAEFMAGFFAHFDLEVSYVSAEIVVVGEWAFDRGSGLQSLKPKDGGPSVSESANYLWLYRRDPTGSWKHARVIWNRRENTGSNEKMEGDGAIEIGQAIGARDEATIRAAVAEYVDAALRQDWGRFTDVFDPNPVCMPPGAAAMNCRSDIRRFYEAFPPLAALALTPVDIGGAGTLAFEWGRYEFSAGGASDRGKYLHVWRRQADGTWKLYRNIANSDGSPSQ